MQRIPSQDQDNSFPKSSPVGQVICLPPGPAFFPPKLMSGESDVGLAPPPWPPISLVTLRLESHSGHIPVMLPRPPQDSSPSF